MLAEHPNLFARLAPPWPVCSAIQGPDQVDLSSALTPISTIIASAQAPIAQRRIALVGAMA